MRKHLVAIITLVISMTVVALCPALGWFALSAYAGWVVTKAVISVKQQLRSSAASSSVRITNR